MKIFLSVLVVFALLSICTVPLMAQEEEELIRTEVIKAEPVNLVRYADATIDWILRILDKILETGGPTFLLTDPIEVGLEATFIEGFLDVERLDLVGGWTFENEEASEFFWGIQYEMALTEDGIFRRLLPSVYNHQGGIVFGMGFELRG